MQIKRKVNEMLFPLPTTPPVKSRTIIKGKKDKQSAAVTDPRYCEYFAFSIIDSITLIYIIPRKLH